MEQSMMTNIPLLTYYLLTYFMTYSLLGTRYYRGTFSRLLTVQQIAGTALPQSQVCVHHRWCSL